MEPMMMMLGALLGMAAWAVLSREHLAVAAGRGTRHGARWLKCKVWGRHHWQPTTAYTRDGVESRIRRCPICGKLNPGSGIDFP